MKMKILSLFVLCAVCACSTSAGKKTSTEFKKSVIFGKWKLISPAVLVIKDYPGRFKMFQAAEEDPELMHTMYMEFIKPDILKINSTIDLLKNYSTAFQITGNKLMIKDPPNINSMWNIYELRPESADRILLIDISGTREYTGGILIRIK